MPRFDLTTLIDAHGHAVLGVFGTETEPGFHYTIGLTETINHPELLVFGLPQQTGLMILNSVVGKIKTIDNLQDGDLIDGVANFPLYVKEIGTERASIYCLQAIYRYDTTEYTPKFMQIVLCDKHGKYPWEDGYAIAMKAVQPELWK